MPLTPETWLAEFTANTTTDLTQLQPRITQLSNGNILIAWTSFNNTGVGAPAGTDIIGQLFDPFGTPIGSEIRLNDFFQGQNEDDFDIAALDNGRFVVVYEDDNNNLVDQTIRATEWATDADGFITPPTAERLILNSTEAGDVVSRPSVTVNPDGSYVVGIDIFDASEGHNTLVIVKVEPDGTVGSLFLGGLGGSNIGADNTDSALLTDGNVVIVTEAGFGVEGIAFNLFNPANGDSIAAFVANTSTNGDVDRNASVVALTGGGFVVAWGNEDANTNDTDIQFQRYANTGAPQGPTLIVGSVGLSDFNTDPELVALPDGGFILFWDSNETGLESGRGRRFDSAGNPVGDEFLFDSSNGRSVEATLLDDGRVALVWFDGEIQSAIIDTRDDANTTLGPSLVQTGAAGDDFFTAAALATAVHAGLGNDTVFSNGAIKEYLLGDGNDLIIVSSNINTDFYDGGSGNDTINWFNASAFVNGAAFNLSDGTAISEGQLESMINFENLFGTSNNDNIVGTGGANLLNGNEGDDNIFGGGGSDTLNGGDGNDTLFGDSGNDTIFGDDGNDVIRGGPGNDLLDGGAGNDTIYALSGGDTINLGGGGADWVIIDGDTAGTLTMTGASIDDTVEFSITSAAITNVGSVFSGGPMTVDLGATTKVFAGRGNDTITEGNLNVLALLDGDDRFIGIADGGSDEIDGGAGRDTYQTGLPFGANANLETGEVNGVAGVLTNFEDFVGDAGGGDDMITAWSGGSNLSGLAGNDTLIGGIGNDTIDGGVGNDRVEGEDGADTMSGGSGNDLLLGGIGADVMSGGDDNDTIAGGNDNDIADGGIGDDLLYGNGGDDTLNGEDGADEISGGNGVDLVRGGNGSDTLRGANQDDRLYGGADDDIVAGNSGNDRVYGGSGNDRLFGGNGDDTLLGEGGEDSIFGGSSNDTVSGGDDNDSVMGGNGNDLLFGNNGDDTLDGEDGADEISGGNGADLVFGRSGEDTLRGANDNDRIFAGANDDIVAGNSGNDTLEGGSGDDRLFGGNDNDVINGGSGMDFLSGGAGQDVFVFESVGDSPHGGSRDTISDFTHNVDQIDLSGIMSGLSFIGNGSYSGVAGEVRYNDTIGRLYIDVDGDSASEFSIDISGAPIIDSNDLIL